MSILHLKEGVDGDLTIANFSKSHVFVCQVSLDGEGGVVGVYLRQSKSKLMLTPLAANSIVCQHCISDYLMDRCTNLAIFKHNGLYSL